MGNKFLVAAYGLLWLLFMLYSWNLSRRHAQLRKELEDLKAKIPNPRSSDAGPS